MKEEQRKLIDELESLLREFKKLDKLNFHERDKNYMVLLKGMEKVALKIDEDTIKELKMEDPELENLVRGFRLKGTWMTFHGFKI
jgi:hypothetical protein